MARVESTGSGVSPARSQSHLLLRLFVELDWLEAKPLR
jgi:hypothetical protein